MHVTCALLDSLSSGTKYIHGVYRLCEISAQGMVEIFVCSVKQPSLVSELDNMYKIYSRIDLNKFWSESKSSTIKKARANVILASS